ncbi:MAG: hypothetical protein K6E76_05515 [Patescibacteria group bacterium]|nr:hypothetical protein [Patescibacteria group bacterium]
MLQQVQQDANNIKCTAHTENSTNAEGGTITTTSYSPTDSNNKGQSLIEFQKAYFSGREEKFADVIMYFYDESVNFQETIEDFSLITFDNLL